MNTKALNSLAELICRAQEQDRTPMGVAFAIDAAGRHMSPEVAAELDRLRSEVAALRDERHSTNEALDDAVQELRAPMSHDPVTVNTRDGRCWRRRGWTPSGHGLYALEGSAQDAEQTLYLIGDLAEFGLRSMAYSVLPPVWDQVRDQVRAHVRAHVRDQVRAHVRDQVRPQALREGEHYAVTHHDYRTGRDMPGPAGVQTSWACKACGSAPDSWCPDCGACQRGCYDGFVDNSCTHAGASWVGVE